MTRHRAIGYVRVSTTMQVESGHSLDAQRKSIADYCELYGLELVDVEADEGLSASNLERPGLTRALERLDAGDAGMLVVVKLDRLTRSVADLGALLSDHFGEGGHDLASVNEKIDTTSAGGRLTLNILTSVAQWEREVISERISTAMQHMKTQGKRTGYIPFGQKLAADGVHLVPDNDEVEVLEIIRARRAEGLSLRGLADWLNANGYTNRGNPWNHTAVRNKLLKPHA
jgi:DNA invertase Pin-like site-specific DNA recombinase